MKHCIPPGLNARHLFAAVISSVLFFSLLILPVRPALGDGDGTLGPPSINIASGTGMVADGVGLRDSQPGTIDIDVPIGAAVNQVLLYWSGDNTEQDDLDIIIEGEEVTGIRIGEEGNDAAYRADITELGLILPGSNSVDVEGLDFGSVSPYARAFGAGLVVIFEEDGAAPRTIDIRDGSDFAWLASNIDPVEETRTTVPQTYSFASAGVDRSAELWMMASDSDLSRPDHVTVTIDGETTTYDSDFFDANDGLEWTTKKLTLTVPAGATEVTVQVHSGPGSNPESVAWILGGLSIAPPPTDGCTLTQGFWKTHPDEWPSATAPDDPFFESGQSWLEVLTTPPAGGNTYYILAHQYIAATLNLQNGADGSAVEGELARAQELLSTTEPTDELSETIRSEFIELSEILDDYNNGIIGPGHCDDESEDEGDDEVADRRGEGGDDAFAGKKGRASVSLNGAYPNPFNPETTIRFTVSRATNVHLAVYDMLGRQVAVLVDGTMRAGQYDVRFDAADLPSGTYLYRLATPDRVITNRVVLLK